MTTERLRNLTMPAGAGKDHEETDLVVRWYQGGHGRLVDWGLIPPRKVQLMQQMGALVGNNMHVILTNQLRIFHRLRKLSWRNTDYGIRKKKDDRRSFKRGWS